MAVMAAANAAQVNASGGVVGGARVRTRAAGARGPRHGGRILCVVRGGVGVGCGENGVPLAMGGGAGVVAERSTSAQTDPWNRDLLGQIGAMAVRVQVAPDVRVVALVGAVEALS